jgi:hypothetical protein
MTLLRLAWLNLSRHRAATALAVLALGLTVACAGMLLRTARLADARFTTFAHAGDALIAAKGNSTDALLGALNAEGPYPRFIPLRLFGTLVNEAWYATGNQSYATSVIPFVYAGKLVSKTSAAASGSGASGVSGAVQTLDEYRVVGTIKAVFDMPQPSPRLTFTEGEWNELGSGVVLGSAVARRENLGPGDTVRIAHWTSDTMPSPAQSGLRPRRFIVSGVLAPTGTAWDRLVFTNLLQAEGLMAEGLRVAGHQTVWTSFVLHYILVHVQPGGLDSLNALIDQRTVTQIVPVLETLESLQRLTASGRTAAAVMALLALLLAVMTLSALMLGRYEGLARQAAVLEAMGWQKSELRRLLLWEGLILGVVAAAFGGALDAALFPLLRSALGGALPDAALVSSPVWTSAPVWVTAVAVTVSASLASSLFLFRGRAQERLRGLG